MIPYARQDITEDDILAVIAALRSDFLTQGPAVPAFEHAVATQCGAKHAIAVNNATSALHIACLALELGPGDILWTTPITFVASANCGLYCGARVDFVDIDPRTYNISVECLEEKLVQAEIEGTLPKVVVPVHLCGQPCDMQTIHALGQKYGFRIIEDASHAIGATYKGEPIGGGRYSDITVFSFHPVKIVTTGEGGIAVTNAPELASRMALLRSHGITRDPNLMTHPADGPWYYQQITLGYNYRLTDIQAALGASQLQRLDAYIARREKLARVYDEALADTPVTIPWQHPYGRSAWHLYVIRLRLGEGAAAHRAVFDALRAAGIGVNLHYIPVHLQPSYRAMGFCEGQFPEAERYYGEAISLPLYPLLSDQHQEQVITELKRALRK